MLWVRIYIFFLILLSNNLFAQRSYTQNSVLATGNWIKISVTQSGLYKVDASFLIANGFGSNIPSNAIRLYGNGGGMLSEANNDVYVDDLIENAIEMVDDGDGIFNKNDYFLFYGTEAGEQIFDSLNRTFYYKKNLYSDTSYYFISAGGLGKRVLQKINNAVAVETISSYDDFFHHEMDAVNLLNSGKEWVGENFSSNQLVKNYTIESFGRIVSEPIIITTKIIGRSVVTNSTIQVLVNQNLAQNIVIQPISGNSLNPFANSYFQRNNYITNNEALNIQIQFSASNTSSTAWLDWFSIHQRKKLQLQANKQLTFTNVRHIGENKQVRYVIDLADAETQIWDISTAYLPRKIQTLFQNNQLSFVDSTLQLKQYLAFKLSNAFTPNFSGKVSPQNLHARDTVDYLIVTHPSFQKAAETLANFHKNHYQYKAKVVTTDAIYNEFSSGIKDPVAIRNFVKMYHDRFILNPLLKPKYLLLFGGASFDYKNRIANNTNYVPCFESQESLHPLNTYTSDDFFALLDDTDNVNNLQNTQLLDIAVGRLPCTSIEEANTMVQKIIQYHQPISLGSWRNTCLFIADDGDRNLHLNDAELMVQTATASNNFIESRKIYLDAFPVERTSSGAKYPLVNSAIVNQLNAGSLILNYTGHGGYNRLAEEAIFTQNEILNIQNANRLPLFITATCDFAPYDDPTKQSLGASLLNKSTSGAIALMTTTRLVFAFSNSIINRNYLNVALKPTPSGNFLTLGQANLAAKNETYRTFSDVINNRKFALIGDPAMRLAFPQNTIVIDSVNNQPKTSNDTLTATNVYTIKGSIKQQNGTTLSNFDGVLHAKIVNAPTLTITRQNDPTSFITTFFEQKNVLFNGTATVKNGNFTFSFIVPKDVPFKVNQLKIRLYAENGNIDASVVDTSFYVIGGLSTNNDTIGPNIQLYLNDTLFRNKGIVQNEPTLLVKLFDVSGINSTGLGIGHDIVATIDSSDENRIILNNFYKANSNTYQSGSIAFKLPNLTLGKHSLTLKAWDALNNASSKTIQFEVVGDNSLLIKKLINYPNPFRNTTKIAFEHNFKGEELDIAVTIYSLTGKIVYQSNHKIFATGNRTEITEWDGKNKYSSEKLVNGVYLNRIIVTSKKGIATASNQIVLH